MNIEHDKTLVKHVHIEQHGRFVINAFLTRYGGLSVFVDDTTTDSVAIWQGDNILEARKIVLRNLERDV